jgi:hypothetical protein
MRFSKLWVWNKWGILMAKRRKSSKCPEPLNTMLDLAGAAVLGAYTRHKILKDYER